MQYGKKTSAKDKKPMAGGMAKKTTIAKGPAKMPKMPVTNRIAPTTR